ncbi:MAG: GlsB/YeaQ/YmgE family stress response membrane protein [Bacteroidales bacterium]|nr:GlsB/YeaQ/YmgE family stress response membrane protein [Bacteroidales bacterium]
MDILITCLIGFLVGSLASWIMKKGFPWYIDILVGVGGSWLGNWIAGLIGMSGGFIFSTIGAVLLIWIISKLKK